MKLRQLTRVLLFALPAGSLQAAAIVETIQSGALSLDVPDGDASGLVHQFVVTSQITEIGSVTVELQISGTYNGDLYVYLAHEGSSAILLNRPGRSGGIGAAAFGYGDDGISITLDDTAANGDVHVYGESTTLAPATPLTGTWQPDGRATDPDEVLPSDDRTAMLSNFEGLPASGRWDLFVADLSGGSQHTLENWSLTISEVPEPGTAILLAIAAGGFHIRRRRSK